MQIRTNKSMISRMCYIIFLLLLLLDCAVSGNQTSVDNATERHVTSLNRTRPFQRCPKRQQNIEMKYLICLIVFIPVTVIGNALVCIVVLSTRTLRKHPMYIFLTSLAIADFLCGAVVMPIKAKIEWDSGCFNLPWFVCWIFIIVEISVSINSTNHLFVVAIDRYIALKYSYRYQQIMSKKKSTIILIGIWSFGLLWSLLSIFQWNKPDNLSILKLNGCAIQNKIYFTATYALWYIAPIFLMIFIYSIVYRITFEQIVKISRNSVHTSKSKKEARKRKMQFKTVRSVVIVFLAYAVCWMPCIILILIVLYSPSIRYVFRTQWFSIVRFVFINFLPHFNSTINPFVYVILNREFLSALKNLVRKMIGKPLVKNDMSRSATSVRNGRASIEIDAIPNMYAS